MKVDGKSYENISIDLKFLNFQIDIYVFQISGLLWYG